MRVIKSVVLSAVAFGLIGVSSAAMAQVINVQVGVRYGQPAYPVYGYAQPAYRAYGYARPAYPVYGYVRPAYRAYAYPRATYPVDACDPYYGCPQAREPGRVIREEVKERVTERSKLIEYAPD